MGQPKAPAAPNLNKLYRQGIKTQLQYGPILAAAEQSARSQYDPGRIQEQQGLQDQFGPKQYDQELAALHQIDPTGTAAREQLGQAVTHDASLGYSLDPAFEQQLTSQIRGAEAARGNVLGNAPVSAEGLYKGNAALQLYQQRLNNLGNFVSGPTPEQQLLAIQPVTPDRTSQYINPNAGQQGAQFGLQNYQNMLAQYQLSGGGRNPWAGAGVGAASGAAQGAVAGGGWGALIGGVAGGVSGYFSDSRLKQKVRTLYRNAAGLKVREYEYKGDPAKQRYRGVMAQEVEKLYPGATGNSDGFMTVSEEFAPVPV